MVPSGRQSSVEEAFSAERQRAFRLATRVRLIIVAVIAAWIPFENPYPAVLYYYAILAAVTGLGVLPVWLPERTRSVWFGYVLPVLDLTLLMTIVLFPNPLGNEPFPSPVRLRFGNEIYLFLLLMAPVLTYSPRLVLWTGGILGLGWLAGVAWMLGLPGSFALPPEGWSELSTNEQLAVFLDPRHVRLGAHIRLVIILFLVTGVLATAVARSRRLVLRQAEAERDRTNLSRYFSPNVVEELLRTEEPFHLNRRQNVAVLFADMAHFTEIASRQPPEEVIRLLREFHHRMAEAVFEHGGTLDKYLGDGLMATFGTPDPGERDAANALRCSMAMVRTMRDWNRQRKARGESVLDVGIGLHYGPVVLGNVGDEKHLEFTVVGDTVNVASRLEELTRETGSPVLASSALAEAARRQGAEKEISAFERIPDRQVRGRSESLEILGLRNEAGVP